MPTAVIAGKTYNTVIMPDGKEWMAEYLQDTAPGGLWYSNDPANAVLGRHYNCAEMATFAYSGGWHVPTKAEWDTMVAATGGNENSAYRLCNKSGWLASSALYANATDQYGLHLTPTGTLYEKWFFREEYAHIWYGLDDPTYSYLTRIYCGGSNIPFEKLSNPVGNAYYGAVRLVRDPLPNAETPVITPATGHSAGPVTAKVSCATAGADIHYTTDGSTPTESSPVLHDGGIVLGSWTSPAVTLKVMASASGHNSSGISTATYQFTAQAPMVSLQMKPESGYFFSEAESRKPRTFGACGKGIFAGTIQWELLDSEWPMFLDWWEDNHKGVNPFNIYCCTGAEPLLHTFQAVGPYEVVRDTGVRKVTLPVKITMRPTGLYSGWGSFLGGPPVAYPVIVPMPQWGFQREEAAVFLSTTGAPTAARPVATRGELLSLEWKALTGMQFDVLVDWWSTYLGQGRRKFTISLPGETGPLLCQLVEDPAFTVEGVHFRGSMKVFAAPVRTLAPPPA